MAADCLDHAMGLSPPIFYLEVGSLRSVQYEVLIETEKI